MKNQKNLSLKWLHKINALIIIPFLIAHIATHLSGVFGISTYNKVQDIFRIVYRQPLIEIILLLSITSQLILGGILLVRSVRRKERKDGWAKLQIYSGGFFLFFMTQHLYSLGMARIYFRLDTNFYWPASVMVEAPWVYYFVPYYFFGVWAIFVHIGVGIRHWIIDTGHLRSGNYLAVGTMIVGAIVSASILPIISGAFFDIHLPQEWIEYMRFYDPNFMKP